MSVGSPDLKIGVTRLIFQTVRKIPCRRDLLNNDVRGGLMTSRQLKSRTAAMSSGPLLRTEDNQFNPLVITSTENVTTEGK